MCGGASPWGVPFRRGCLSVRLGWLWLMLLRRLRRPSSVSVFSSLCRFSFSFSLSFFVFVFVACLLDFVCFFCYTIVIVSQVVLVVPASLSSLLTGPGLVGFSGSRGLPPAVLSSVLCLRGRSSGESFVGCAAGVDHDVRVCLRSARVFRASDFGVGRGSFAARSIAFVRALSVGGGVLVSFPSSSCPSGLRPWASASRCFSGLGSGSWASLAFAIGSGVPCWVYSPCGVPSGWGFVAAGGGWFSFVPAAVQSSLF